MTEKDLITLYELLKEKEQVLKDWENILIKWEKNLELVDELCTKKYKIITDMAKSIGLE